MSAARQLSPSLLADIERRVESRAAQASRITWPSQVYQTNPVGFARDVLDRELWTDGSGHDQVGFVQACAVPDGRVSVVGGHKNGKTTGEAVVALWAFASFKRVRVFLFAPKIEHIEKVQLWKEIKDLYRNSGRCKKCRQREHEACDHRRGIWECDPVEPCAWCSPLGESDAIGDDPTKGLRSPDGRREIMAYTSRSIDALGGLSGAKIFMIYEEAGGIAQSFFDAMKGNEAGGVTRILTGNPLHTSGELYDSHHSKRAQYTHVASISAKQSPNVRARAKVIPGLATQEWIEERAQDWGRDSTIFRARVLGEFPKYEPGQLLRMDEIVASNARWEAARFEGRLQIGVDVAFTGDDASVAIRRGIKIDSITDFSGIDADGLAVHVAGIARDHRRPHERPPLVVYDAQGKAGADFSRAIRQFDHELEIVAIWGNAKPRDERRYLMRRDELAHGFAAWCKRGGALPPNTKLEGEIGQTIARPVNRDKHDFRARIPSNDELRAVLGRSPDRRNACELACADVADGDGLGSAAHRPEDRPAPGSVPQAAPIPGEPERRLHVVAGQAFPADHPKRAFLNAIQNDPSYDDPWGAADAGLRAMWGDQS